MTEHYVSKVPVAVVDNPSSIFAQVTKLGAKLISDETSKSVNYDIVLVCDDHICVRAKVDRRSERIPAELLIAFHTHRADQVVNIIRNADGTVSLRCSCLTMVTYGVPCR